jgi:hypothetical protein
MAHAYNVYAGEGVYELPRKKGKIRFRPKGRLILHAGEEDVVRLGGGSYSARFFVGLNVGGEERWKVQDVVDLVIKTRHDQGAGADASILSQKGIYESKKGTITEPSVQVIIIDLVGKNKGEWIEEMTDLGEVLQEKFEQESVILEIQKSGVVTDVYSIS